MFARSALRATSSASRSMVARQQMARRAYTVPTAGEQIQAFFKARPVPVDVYPILTFTAMMCSYCVYMTTKHIREDNDHVRWGPGMGGVKFQLPADSQ
ncbi:uncharacterized protein I303_101331 [Kwoniella dejecticola CBS 10117]|uniref:Uncharacterized protein n=1 Tax=Kwoniella dejecticola CBS 10117 TaxID=1296121 RepID=A0A1A6AHG5_9TREE|nr:uncharacterized protein I303_01340 [Kwoniella dejecticola CBS 10117]OBR89512.1 hypothetical protein I303_01340 [Kwoniella dejecticola CBS 10117]